MYRYGVALVMPGEGVRGTSEWECDSGHGRGVKFPWTGPSDDLVDLPGTLESDEAFELVRQHRKLLPGTRGTSSGENGTGCACVKTNARLSPRTAMYHQDGGRSAP